MEKAVWKVHNQSEQINVFINFFNTDLSIARGTHFL